MADEDLSESRSDENIFEILQKEAPFVSQLDESKEFPPFDDYNAPKSAADMKKHHCSLPGLQPYHLQRRMDLEQAEISAGIDNVVNNKQQASPPEPKRPRLLMPTNVQNGNNTNSDACQSPESGKRRRVQHDYRRLSSSGYGDDYEKGKDSRFSLSSDSDTSPNIAPKPRSNNSSPKTKPPNPFIGLKLLSLEKHAVGE